MERSSFELFLDLITFDQSLHETEKKLALALTQVEQVKSLQKRLLSEQEAVRAHVHALKKEVDVKEREMKELDTQEKSAKSRLGSISNQKEYQALKDEALVLKKKQHDYEATLMTVWSTYETAQKELQKHESEFESHCAHLAQELSQHEAIINESKAFLDAASHERRAKEQGVPEAWLLTYSRMRNSVKNPVVKLVGDSCSACFHSLTIHDAQTLKTLQLLQCKGCFRFIYDSAQENLPS